MVAGTPFVIAGFDATLMCMPRRARRWVDRDARIRSRARNAVCLVSKDGMVVLALQRVGDGTMQAFVLMALSDSSAGAFARNEASMVAIARDMGASSLAFRSVRRGWRKLLGPHWVEVGDTFQRSV